MLNSLSILLVLWLLIASQLFGGSILNVKLEAKFVLIVVRDGFRLKSYSYGFFLLHLQAIYQYSVFHFIHAYFPVLS